VVHLTTYLDLESLKIRRSGFNFKLNLTSAIGNLANCNILAGYVSCLNAMTYDREAVKEEGNGKGGKSNGDGKWLLEISSIKDVYSTSKNPQSNAICERMHQTVNNVLRTQNTSTF
jgi:hypothetical protein